MRNHIYITLVPFLPSVLAYPAKLLLNFATIPPTHDHEALVGEACFELVVSAVLVLLGGLFSGLTLGLMGLDELHLQVLAGASESSIEKQNARKVLKLMKDKGRHWVLVSLLLSNVVTNESLPIFLNGAVGGGIMAVLISTASIVVFGIIPQAVCVRYGLAIGAKCVPFVDALTWITAPLAYPIAKVLDHVLGGTSETHVYKKAQLKTFLQLHRTGAEPLLEQEVNILQGVLELGAKHVGTIMTPIEDVVKLSADAILDQDTLTKIISSGCSRIPVYEPHNPLAFIGFLLVKKLLQYDYLLNRSIRDLQLSVLPEAPPSINCFQALEYFQTGRAHLLLVSKTPGIPGGALGIVTLEDIIEEIIAGEIVDETDRYVDNVHKITARRLTTSRIMHGIVERSHSRHSSLDSYESTLADDDEVPVKHRLDELDELDEADGSSASDSDSQPPSEHQIEGRSRLNSRPSKTYGTMSL